MKQITYLFPLLIGFLLSSPLTAKTHTEMEISIRNAEEVVRRYENGSISEERALQELERIEWEILAKKKGHGASTQAAQATQATQTTQAIGASMVRAAAVPGSVSMVEVIGRILVGYILPFILWTTAFIAVVFMSVAAYSTVQDRYNQYRVRYEVRGFRALMGAPSPPPQRRNAPTQSAETLHSGQVPAHLV